jgi:hypothetical protein
MGQAGRAGLVCIASALAFILFPPFALHAQDRAVVWLRADGGRFERDLNQAAARGLRLAAVSDGLPCACAVLQTPEESGGQDEYRVVKDGEVAPQLPTLVEAGFVPRLSAQGAGNRYNVIFERGPSSTSTAVWRAVEFAKLEDLEVALVAAAGEGYQARVLVRPPNRSWPGMSSRGLLLAARLPGATARETRIIAGSGRDVADEAKALTAATGQGWSLDLMFTATGTLSARRERLMLLLSRDRSVKPSGRAVTLERSSSFGLVGSAVQVASVPFWDEYLFAWAPADRRQVWARPVRLGEAGEQCSSIEHQLRLEGPRAERSTIVGAVGKPAAIRGFDLVLLVEERLGPR